MTPLQFTEYAKIIQNVFGKPSKPETEKRIRTKIKRKGPDQYYAMVKFSFFGKWKKLGWCFFDEQPGKGFTNARASIKSLHISPKTYGMCVELIDDYKKHRGEGITIW